MTETAQPETDQAKIERLETEITALNRQNRKLQSMVADRDETIDSMEEQALETWRDAFRLQLANDWRTQMTLGKTCHELTGDLFRDAGLQFEPS